MFLDSTTPISTVLKISYFYLVYQIDNYMFVKNVAWQFRAWTAGHNVVL